jgi:hypothetical protein
MTLRIWSGSVTPQPAEGGLHNHSSRRTPEGRMTVMTDMRNPQRGQAMMSTSMVHVLKG